MHFAALALVAESVEHPERYWRTNVTGTLNLLDGMRAHGVGRLVFSSTCATYGDPETVPMSEDEPTDPVNAYGDSKLAVDRMLATECRAHGLGAASLRYFNVAGASGELGEDHEPETHLIPLVLQAAAGRRPHISVFGTDYPTRDGTAVRDYIHVEDLGEAHLLALDALQPGRHRVYNLGTGTGYSVREVVEAARRVTGREIVAREEPRRPGDPPELVAAAEPGAHGARLGAAPRPGRDDRRRLGLAPGAPGRLRRLSRQQRLEGAQRRGQHVARRLRGVEDREALGLGGGQRVVRGRDAGEEARVLALEPVGVVAPGRRAGRARARGRCAAGASCRARGRPCRSG